MTILLTSRDEELIGRCRRAVSAEHPFEAVPDVAALFERVRATTPVAVLLDSAALEKPLEKQAAAVVATTGAGRVIVMTEEFREEEEIALLRAGAKGVCRRGIDPDSLQRVINVTQTGGVWVTRSLLPRLVLELRRAAAAPREAPAATRTAVRPATDKLDSLSSRERDIVRLIVEGASNKEVAAALNISERTVKGHLSNVFQKLGVSDRLKLVLLLKGA
jgi:DNA-binding NarL/FixJ family response regulator